MLLNLRRDELDAINELRVLIKLLDDLSCFEVPDDYLGVLACACYESIAFTDVDVSDVVEVPVQRGLKCQCLPVPDLDNSTKVIKK